MAEAHHVLKMVFSICTMPKVIGCFPPKETSQVLTTILLWVRSASQCSFTSRASSWCCHLLPKMIFSIRVTACGFSKGDTHPVPRI